jgi:hypothetical protein
MTATDQFTQLCDGILDGSITESNTDARTLFDIIGHYVREIEHVPAQRRIFEGIQSAPEMINVRVRATENPTKQFYKFAKAITYWPDTFRSRMSSPIILHMLNNDRSD